MKLNESMLLTKTKLSMSILGFFNLCMEFRPAVFHEFIESISSDGRPLFAHYMHKTEKLATAIPMALCRVLRLQPDSPLYNRIQQRMVFYDNNHTLPVVVETIQLRKASGPSVNLTETEFSDLLCVALYLHDVRDLKARFENVVLTLIADQQIRELTHKLCVWIIEDYIKSDIESVHSATNTEAGDRVKWPKCEKMENIALETLIDCALNAKGAMQLLRTASRVNSFGTMEKLFQHYIKSCPPSSWTELFKNSKEIAYFIKYVDAEDLCLAYTKFYEINKINFDNKCFWNHLLQVRSLYTKPVVSGQELVALTSSKNSQDDSFKVSEKLLLEADQMDKSKEDLAMIYRLTAAWMKVSTKTVMMPLPPRNAQNITVLTVAAWAKRLLVHNEKNVGKAVIAQVGTGEGKSLIIAMTAIYFVKVLNKRVHILENNPGLLAKDVEKMTPLYKEFGIERRGIDEASIDKRDLTSTTMESLSRPDVRHEFTKFGVTYTMRSNIERYYQNCIMNGEYEPLKDTVLIVDEVDDLIVDANPNTPYATRDNRDEKEFRNAFDALKSGKGLDIEKLENSMVWSLADFYKKDADRMVLNENYKHQGNTLVALEGSAKRVVYHYDYRLEFLKYAIKNIPPVLKTTYYVQSIPFMLSQYSCIAGFSGSIGTKAERKFLCEKYNVWWFDTPSYLNTCTNVRKMPPQLMDDPVLSKGVACVHVYPTTEAQHAKLVEIALRLYRSVPVLIIAKSTGEAYEIEEKIKAAVSTDDLLAGAKAEDYYQMFMEYDRNSSVLNTSTWANTVHRATFRKKEEDRFCITITDPFGGRGHDFDVNSEEVNSRGGLAIIMTSIASSERVFKQWKGRTARKDNKGQYAVVLCSEDPLISQNEGVLKECVTKDTIEFVYSEKLIEKLQDKQDEKQREILRNLDVDMNKGMRLNKLCDEFYSKNPTLVMKEETWPLEAQVSLRNILTLPLNLVNSRQINEEFSGLGLSDKTGPKSDPPDISSSVFWSEKEMGKWIRLQTEQEAAQKASNKQTELAKLQSQSQTRDKDSRSFSPTRNVSPVNLSSASSTSGLPKSLRRLPTKIKLDAGSHLDTDDSAESESSSCGDPMDVDSDGDIDGNESIEEILPEVVSSPLAHDDNPSATDVAASGSTPIRQGSSDSNALGANSTVPDASVPINDILNSDFDEVQSGRIGHTLMSSIPGPIIKGIVTEPKMETQENEALWASPVVSVVKASDEVSKIRASKKFKTSQQGVNEGLDQSSSDGVMNTEKLSEDTSTKDMDAAPIASNVSKTVKKEKKKKAKKNSNHDQQYIFEQPNSFNGASNDIALDFTVEDPAPENIDNSVPVAELCDEIVVDDVVDEDYRDEGVDNLEQQTADTDNADTIEEWKEPEEPEYDENRTAESDVPPPPPPPSEPSTSVNTMSTDSFGFSSTGVSTAYQSSGRTVTSAREAADLSAAANLAREVTSLDRFVVGTTVKLTVNVSEEIRNSVGKEQALEVSVFEGEILAKGLKVTGTLKKTFANYIVVFQATTTGNVFDTALFGKRKLVASWESQEVFTAMEVEFEPAFTDRPSPEYSFVDSTTGRLIKKNGTVHFGCEKDPRSVKPFTERIVKYVNGQLIFPEDLPNAIITITPQLEGFQKTPDVCIWYNKNFKAENKQINLSPADLCDGEWRVQLSWGMLPTDLDLYCVTNLPVGRVYWKEPNKGGRDNVEMGRIELDKDVRKGKGPETITFTPNPENKYRFVVSNYSKEIPIVESNAKIVLVDGAGNSKTIDIPTDIKVNDKGENCSTWHVFDYFEGKMNFVNRVVKRPLMQYPV